MKKLEDLTISAKNIKEQPYLKPINDAIVVLIQKSYDWKKPIESLEKLNATYDIEANEPHNEGLKIKIVLEQILAIYKELLKIRTSELNALKKCILEIYTTLGQPKEKKEEKPIIPRSELLSLDEIEKIEEKKKEKLKGFTKTAPKQESIPIKGVPNE